MRLLELEVTNFRCFEQHTFTLSDRVLLAGPTGSGKSSVLHAIAWALTGRCLGVDARGSGQQHLIRDGADEARVRLTIEGFPVQIERTVNAKGATANLKPDAIAQKLGVSSEELLCLLYADRFFTLGHAEAKDLIFRILDVTIQPEDVPGLNIAKPLTFDELTMHYDDVFRRRAGAKKALELHVVPEAPKVAQITDGPIGDVDALRTAAETAKQAARAAANRAATAKSKRDTSKDEYQRALGSSKSLSSLQSSLDAQIKMRDELAEEQKRLGPAEMIPSADTSERAKLERLIESLDRHDPARGCVLDAAIPCLTRAQEFVGKVSDLRKTVADITAAEKAAQADAEAVRGRNAQRTQNDRQLTMHETEIKNFRRRIAEAEKEQANISRLEADQPILEAAEISARRESADADQTEAQAAQRHEAALRYYASTQGRDVALARRKALEEDVAKLETLVELLGPKGIRIKVLERTVKQFEEMINQALTDFGFKLFIQADPWQVQVGRVMDPFLAAGDNPEVDPQTIKPWIGYSDGEKIAIGLAFQQALAVITGVDFLCVDAGEQVTGDFRGTLTALVMTSPVTQILVAMGKGPREPVPVVDGLQVIPFNMEPQPVASS